MKIIASWTLLAALTTSSHAAITEEDFARCVKIKEFVLKVIEQANRGVTREDLKSRLNSDVVNPTIDFVYDFRGAKSDQQIVAQQMDSCLRQMEAKSRRKK